MATLTDTNVYENRATNPNQDNSVCSPVEPCLSAHQAPRYRNITCAHGWQEGGGLAIYGTATLTDTNVYKNRATDVDQVRSPVEPCLSAHQAPRWNLT